VVHTKAYVYKIYINFVRRELILPAIRDEKQSILNTAIVVPGSLQACNFLDKGSSSPWDQLVCIMGTAAFSAMYLVTAAGRGQNSA